MSGLTLDQLLADPANPSDGPSVISYISDSAGDILEINADGSLNVSFASGAAVEITDGTDTLAVNADGSINAVVTATDLDIRDLSASQDNVAISDGTDTLSVNADGSINVNLTDDGIADDEADSGNPFKIGGRGVSTLSALSAANDRFDMVGDLYRRVHVNDAANIGIKATDSDVTGTAAEVVATPLAGRKGVTIQNRGDKSVFVGEAVGVTAATGLEIPKKSSLTLPLGENCDIFMIADSGTQDVRFLEIA